MYDKRGTTVQDILDKRKDKHVHRCQPNIRISEALEIMVREGLTHLPVVDKGELKGVVTYAELKVALAMEQAGKPGEPAQAACAGVPTLVLHRPAYVGDATGVAARDTPTNMQPGE